MNGTLRDRILKIFPENKAEEASALWDKADKILRGEAVTEDKTEEGAMTREEFEKGYAIRSGTTVKRLYELGQVAVPCDCGEDGCNGWAMVRKGGPNDEYRCESPGVEKEAAMMFVAMKNGKTIFGEMAEKMNEKIVLVDDKYIVVREEVSAVCCCYELAACVADGFVAPQKDWIAGIGRASARIAWKTSCNTSTSRAIYYCPFCGAKLTPK